MSISPVWGKEPEDDEGYSGLTQILGGYNSSSLLLLFLLLLLLLLLFLLFALYMEVGQSDSREDRRRLQAHCFLMSVSIALMG